MKRHLPRLLLIALASVYWPSMALAADPVPLDCDPSSDCQPIDPCAMAPERCQEPTIPTTPPPPLPDSSDDE
ncbi:hypothetical protein Tola_3042 [Tolumonas auensis DSM 9187]|uniref:Uncharacterized protein n=1 Tax=Tolumonas auensis (strain DSM 9187 / NBRC 110442 / TA 4) TaxID=595494 RepID=C4LDA0_TOLAT|nr:hypothetical protein [Tolumonas auensis]ACQ94631.1 hypothetical protein Tola_3042 [Tolumonas auensis DSM 9187]